MVIEGLTAKAALALGLSAGLPVICSAVDNACMTLIDISAVRTQHSLEDVADLANLARQYHFINAHILPAWVKILRKHLDGISDIYVGSPVGFPIGGHETLTKLIEAQQRLQDGVQEIDIVMNIGRFKNKDYRFVADELEAIVRLSGTRAVTKVIVEINTLTNNECCAPVKLLPIAARIL